MDKTRLISLDVLRGLTVALMITVNNGGGKMIYSTLEHSKWERYDSMRLGVSILFVYHGNINFP